MRKLVLFILLFINIDSYCQNFVDIVKEEEKSVVLIKTYDKDGDPLLQGTGFFIDSVGKIVSNYHAITGKDSEREYLIGLGAKEIILRKDFEAADKRPLLKPTYAGAIDTVGGVILDNIIKSTMAMGVVTCCGNVASPKLDLTVFPFILRGIALIGIDSQNYPMEYRERVWRKLANEWKPNHLNESCYVLLKLNILRLLIVDRQSRLDFNCLYNELQYLSLPSDKFNFFISLEV